MSPPYKELIELGNKNSNPPRGLYYYEVAIVLKVAVI